jgi:small-conductance mechanosensitive channel
MSQQDDVLRWGLYLIIGFPVSVIVLNEAVERLERRGRSLAAPLRLVRNLVLPSVALQLLLSKVLGLEAGALPTLLAETLVCLTLLPAVLSLLNAMMAAEGTSSGWWTHLPKLLFQLMRLGVLLTGIAFLLTQVWGIDLTGVMTALGIGSLVMALALQDTLSNLVSGVLLIFERPFKVGDWLRSGEVVGQVVEINWRSVRLRTTDGDLVVIPNGFLGKEVIHNYSQPSLIHAERMELKLPSTVPPNPARHMLLDLLRTTRGVLEEPAPRVSTLAYEEQFTTYELKFSLGSFEAVEQVRHELMTRAYYVAKRHGIALVPSEESAEDGRDAHEGLTQALGVLSSALDLAPEALATLVRGAVQQLYGEGEEVLRAGTPGEGLYIIVSGAAAMRALDGQGRPQEICRLKRGDFFGEIPLSSHAASSVTVTALEDLELLLLQPETVMDLAQRNPGFAQEMEQILEARRKAVQPLVRGAPRINGADTPRGMRHTSP